jgi:hypothetical protein
VAKKTKPAKKPKKPATPKLKPKKPASGATAMSAPKVRVRMYRQGLGDCFLITFDPDGTPTHMLIDCGTLGATTTGNKLAKVVDDIVTTTGGHLHVLIATHEHLDHVSGFRSQKAKFEGLTIDEAWMAWTENPEDDLAKDIKVHNHDLGVALKAAARALAAPAASPRAAAMGEAITSILGFADENPLGADFAPTVDEAMHFVRKEAAAKTRYFKPGAPPIEESWLPGFRIFVLGPPRDEDALSVLGEHGSSELYALAGPLKSAAALFESNKPAVETFNADGEARTEFAASLPFDVRFRHEATDRKTQEMFAPYLADAEKWRRIDEDWLHLASDLALQLDGATNNTSLVLAIERIADGKVLLFPADAQEGNWVSWHDAANTWTVTGGPGAGTVTAKNLLARTVFYKVGHHSSHNATAKGSGLELMLNEDELTAFIPVDRAVALNRNPKDSWQMPALALYRRLLEKCQGRVVRSDIGWAADAATAANADAEEEFLGMATAQEWTTWATAQAAASVTIGGLFVDYVLD